MKTIKTSPEFADLDEATILAAIDKYEGATEDAPDNGQAELPEPEDPIVDEVARLISEFTNKFDSYYATSPDKLDKILDFEPEHAIEKIAYEIFSDALFDTLQDEFDDIDD